MKVHIMSKRPFTVRFKHRPQHFVHILQPGKHRPEAITYAVQEIMAKTPRICCYNWSAFGSDGQTISFGQPHKKRSHGARPGFWRGHSMPNPPTRKMVGNSFWKVKKKMLNGCDSCTESYSYTDTILTQIWSLRTATSWPIQFSHIYAFTSHTL